MNSGFSQDWSKGYEQAQAYAPPPPLPAAQRAFELRPLSTGEILDRTFTLYRQRFWLYSGISALACTVTVLGQIARYATVGWAPAGRLGNVPKETAISLTITVVMSLLFFVAWSFAQAATISAVSAAYLGHDTSIGRAVRSVRGHWWRYVLITLWQMWSILWVPLLFIGPAMVLVVAFRGNTGLVALGGGLMLFGSFGFIYGVIAYLRNSLAIAASVSESLKVRASMRRSKDLVAGHKGRIFLLLLLVGVLSSVGAAAQAPLAFLLLKAHAGERIVYEGLVLLVTFLTNALIGPVQAISLCLFYIDERVRKEGFDIEALMDQSFLGVSAVAAAPGVAPGYSSSEPA